MSKQNEAEKTKQRILEKIAEKIALQSNTDINAASRHGAHASSHGSSKSGGGYTSKGTHGNHAH